MTYTISSVRETGTITYHCPTPGSALDKLQDFQRAAYSDIKIVAGGEVFPERRLIDLASLEKGGRLPM